MPDLAGLWVSEGAPQPYRWVYLEAPVDGKFPARLYPALGPPLTYDLPLMEGGLHVTGIGTVPFAGDRMERPASGHVFVRAADFAPFWEGWVAALISGDTAFLAEATAYPLYDGAELSGVNLPRVGAAGRPAFGANIDARFPAPVVAALQAGDYVEVPGHQPGQPWLQVGIDLFPDEVLILPQADPVAGRRMGYIFGWDGARWRLDRIPYFAYGTEGLEP
ncbi:MAG: hypothetical protein D6722_22770 [Bacteroidetes bacterium]|nr:MAG: hypothetical protein D6722_22770 [Bacteroidota bacterium]